MFGANLTRYPELDDVVQDVTIKKGMWEAMVEVRRCRLSACGSSYATGGSLD